MTRLPRNKCRHLEGSFLTHREVGIWTMWTSVCVLCGELLPLGHSDESPVAVEVRAAEIAADAADGVGLGGHRPDHCDGEHCWHWSADEDGGPCCYCDHVYEDETACNAGYLARCIHDHDRSDEVPPHDHPDGTGYTCCWCGLPCGPIRFIADDDHDAWRKAEGKRGGR